MAAEMDLAKFDDVFLGILQHLGKIEPFLEAIFYFLARRTDFFKLMHNRDDKMGFPPGVAKQVVTRIFDKYQTLVLGPDPQKPREGKASSPQKTTKGTLPVVAEKVPEVARIVEIESGESETSKSEEPKPVDGAKKVPGSDSMLQEKCVPDELDAKHSHTEGSVQQPITERQEEKPPPKQDADSFNGAVTDKYSWAQTHMDIDVQVPVPNFVKKSKDIEVKIESNRLRISLRDNPPTDSGLSSKVLVEGKFTKRIRDEESLWSLVPGECIQIQIEKAKELYWTALLEGEPEIDKTQLDTTRDISEFDNDTQSDFQKVIYDHRQKLQGKPTSQEQKTHDLLRQAWDAEGSPFKGTPFDPSSVNISS